MESMDNPINRIPFNPYDFFGYLASGLLILADMELITGIPHILGKDPKIVEAVILIIAVYVTGQIVATPAKALLEDGFIGKVLGRPNVNLFKAKEKGILSFVFPGYYRPFPEQIRKKILDKAESEGIKGTGEDLFLHVRYNAVVLQNEKLMDKLNTFLNQYGFNRNLCFSALVVGLALLLKAKFSSQYDPVLMKYSVMALVASGLLLYRYLKFFRQYSYEMFNIYGGTK